MPNDSFAGMRARIEKCRLLAAAINDEKARLALLQMADEIEADIKGFEADDRAHQDAVARRLIDRAANDSTAFDVPRSGEEPLDN